MVAIEVRDETDCIFRSVGGPRRMWWTMSRQQVSLKERYGEGGEQRAMGVGDWEIGNGN